MAKGNNINIGVGADVSGLKTGMDEAAKTVQAAGSKMESAAKDATTKSENAFKNLSQAYRTTAKDAQEIAYKQGITSQAFEEAAAKARDYKAQLDQVNAAIYGVNSNQVPFTNTSSGFNGLSNSINQITREMPAFTYSIQTGFMAVSNNIPMFVDQVNNLKRANAELAAAGQPTKSILQQVGQSLFSFQTLMGVGITVLTVYGAKIFEFTAGLIQADSELAKSNRLLEQQRIAVASVAKSWELFKGIYGEGFQGADAERFQAIEQYNAKIEELTKRSIEIQNEEAESGKKNFGARSLVYYALQANLDNYNKKLAEISKNETERNKKRQKELDEEFEKNKKVYSGFAMPTSEIQGKQGIMKGNLLGDLPEQLKVGKIAIEDFVTSTDGIMDDWAKKNSDAFDTLKKAMVDIGTNAFGQLGTMIGQSLAGADTNINQFFGNIADQLGSAMIAIGSAMLVGSAATAGATSPMAYGYLAGGFALKAVAGYLGSSGGKDKKVGGSSGSGGGGYSPNNGFSGFTPSNNSMVLTTRLIGTDLLMSVQKSGQQMGRVR